MTLSVNKPDQIAITTWIMTRGSEIERKEKMVERTRRREAVNHNSVEHDEVEEGGKGPIISLLATRRNRSGWC